MYCMLCLRVHPNEPFRPWTRCTRPGLYRQMPLARPVPLARRSATFFSIYLGHVSLVVRSRAVSRDPADRYQLRPNSSPVAKMALNTESQAVRLMRARRLARTHDWREISFFVGVAGPRVGPPKTTRMAYQSRPNSPPVERIVDPHAAWSVRLVRARWNARTHDRRQPGLSERRFQKTSFAA